MDELLKYEIAFPESWTFLWSPEEAANIPQEHKYQIHFLNLEGTEMVKNYLSTSKMIGPSSEPEWTPFSKNYFQEYRSIPIGEDSEKEIKKWLYNLGLPFQKYVLIDADRSGHSVLLTWKMVIKYWEGLFFADDLAIFDQSLNWCLFFSHEDYLFYGKNNVFDEEAEYAKTNWINKLKNDTSTTIRNK